MLRERSRQPHRSSSPLQYSRPSVHRTDCPLPIRIMQTVFSPDPSLAPLTLPCGDEFVMPGVRWGDAGEAFTPAFWRALLYQAGPAQPTLKLGRTLLEETAACLLGGYGMPAEVGLAAFARMKQLGLLHVSVCEDDVLQVLQEPLTLSDGSSARYRFAKTKAAALAGCMARFDKRPPDMSPKGLRAWLLDLPGIGLKTASWIVRNHLDSDEVAILDVHLLRAGHLMGLFPSKCVLPRHYLELEARFVAFAQALGVRASHLDACIWAQMKKAGSLAHDVARKLKHGPKAPHRQVRKPATTTADSKQLVLL